MTQEKAMEEVLAVRDYACTIADTEEDRKRIFDAFEVVLMPARMLEDAEVVSTVSREDIASLMDADDRPLFDAEAVKAIPQALLGKIASKMGEGYTESGAFWDALEDLAEAYQIKKAVYA